MSIYNPPTPAMIGAVPIEREIIAGMNMSGGGTLENDVTLNASGGGGNIGYFGGATGSAGSAATNAYATMGSCFRVQKDVSINEIGCFLDGNTATTPYSLTLAKLKNVTVDSAKIVTAFNIDSVLITTTSRNCGFTQAIYFGEFLSPMIDLDAGSIYFIGCVNTIGGGTEGARLCYLSSGGATIWNLNGPFETLRGYFGFNTVGLSPNQTFNDNSTGFTCISCAGFLR